MAGDFEQWCAVCSYVGIAQRCADVFSLHLSDFTYTSKLRRSKWQGHTIAVGQTIASGIPLKTQPDYGSVYL
jgi:hypothetical protein